MARPIWFHAISVGELNALIPLLYAFMGRPLVLSVGTTTAHKLAQDKLKEEIETNLIRLIYMPWDHPYIVSKVLDQIQPSAVILMESEIWPALINEAYKRQIKTIVINAKLSDISLKYYKLATWFIAPIFRKLSLVLAQSAQHCRKYIEMQVDPDHVYMTGNIKFAALPDIKASANHDLRAELGYSKENIVWVCGSTHPEEETLLVAIFQELQTEFPELRLILAPRHPERFNTVETIINSAAHLIPHRFSRHCEELATKQSSGQNDILLIDTIGDLMKIYSIANIVLVGGTINETIGGHNVLEPACHAAPVVVGPYFHKNTEMVHMLEQADGLLIAETKEDIRLIIKDLASHEHKRIVMGANGKKLVESNRKILTNVATKLKQALGEQQ
jgi:3-deoxy-D-manno-octulosonic-acid transferase